MHEIKKGSLWKHRTLPHICAALLKDRRGAVAVILAVALVMIVSAIGAGIDLMTAYSAQQKLTEVAALACQYAGKISNEAASTANANSATGPVGLATYDTNVNNFITNTLTAQHFTPTYTQTTATPFVGQTGGAGTVTLTSSVPTTLMQVVGFTTVPIAAKQNCAPSQILPDSSASAPPSANTILSESFERNPCGSNVCYTQALHTSSNSKYAITASQTFPADYAYVGDSQQRWKIVGYCLETDQVGVINAKIPNGEYAAELDCDNGTGTAGNSSISTSIYLPLGNYELRYYYRSRIDYPNYDPTYICGSSANDTSWANDSKTLGFAQVTRTNQINVYLDVPLADGSAPLHTTLDGTEQLAGQNLIDECVYSANWVQRSVRIVVTTASYYWLTFAADGANDSFGGQIDDIQLCSGTCSGAVQDNFPSASVNPQYPGGTLNPTAQASFPNWANDTLFEDTFESPSYTVANGANGNLNSSSGTSGTNASGWPAQAASGWATAPVNQVTYDLAGPAQGAQAVWLSAASSDRSPSSNWSRLISRSFLLVPGFYNLTYDYVSQATFPSLTSTFCGATASLANMSALSGNGTGVGRNTTTALSGVLNTNTVAAFISGAQLVNTPNYTPSTTSALLDVCGYSAGWTTRSVNFEIAKTGYYWLSFSSELAGYASYGGAEIDDVRLTALGSPAMSSPPSGVILVPVGSPQTSSINSYTGAGFSIVSDPLIFPAPEQ
jgi:Flp pilus assembly protein TadG